MRRLEWRSGASATALQLELPIARPCKSPRVSQMSRQFLFPLIFVCSLVLILKRNRKALSTETRRSRRFNFASIPGERHLSGNPEPVHFWPSLGTECIHRCPPSIRKFDSEPSLSSKSNKRRWTSRKESHGS